MPLTDIDQPGSWLTSAVSTVFFFHTTGLTVSDLFKTIEYRFNLNICLSLFSADPVCLHRPNRFTSSPEHISHLNTAGKVMSLDKIFT